MEEKKFLAIIPARGGSKGIPKKNIVDLGGQPLISYSIQVALEVSKIKTVIVSTDDPEIARISESYGAEVPFLRDKNISQDDSSTSSVIKDVLKRTYSQNDYSFDYVVLLQPTSPFRTALHVSEAIETYLALEDHEQYSLISVRGIEAKYNWIMTKNEKAELSFLSQNVDHLAGRQNQKSLYIPNGAIFIAHKSSLASGDFYQNKLLAYQMDEKSSLDIDTSSDLELARGLF